MSSTASVLLRRYAHPVALGLVVAGWLFLGFVFLHLAPARQSMGYDAFAYWNVSMPNPYTVGVGGLGAFNYAPPVAMIADWFGALEWWVFLWVWTLLLVGTVVWIAGSSGWVLVAFAIPFVTLELYHGNIHILLAAAIVLGFRHPWTWSFVLLTKPTAGVGLLWFAVRREWRQLGTALGATVAICALSFVLAPSLWRDYVEFMVVNSGNMPNTVNINVPLWLRLVLAAVLVVWGARTDRRWTVVVSAMIAVPVLWIASGAMLVGLIPELRARVRRAPSPAWPDRRQPVGPLPTERAP